MARTVFISHSSVDFKIAEKIAAALEGSNIRCWIAPRDIAPGEQYSASIINALRNSRALVLLLTAAANISTQVIREIERAAEYGLQIIPLRAEDVELAPAMEYFISSPQWIKFAEQDRSDGLARLIDALQDTLAIEEPLRPLSEQVSPARALLEQVADPLIHDAVGPYTEDDPPRIGNFVARSHETRFLSESMTKAGLIVVAGLPGVGKTQLAAQVRSLALEQGRPTFWRKLTNLDHFGQISREIAAFYLARGLDGPARQFAMQADEGTMQRTILKAAKDDRTVFIFDNWEACDCPHMAAFAQAQTGLSGASVLLMTTRTIPTWLTERDTVHEAARVLELGGFTRDETETFLATEHLQFRPDIFDLIQDRTKGHPLLLDLLCSQIISYGLEGDEISDSLPDLSWDLDQYLLKNIYEGISDLERHLLGYLSVAMLPLSTRELTAVVADVASRDEVMSGLRSLERRRLAQRSKMSYVIHAVVRDFVYEHASDVEMMHSRMADLLLANPQESGRVLQEACRHLSLSGRQSEADSQTIQGFSTLWTGGFRTWSTAAVTAAVDHARQNQDSKVQLEGLLLLGRLHLEGCRWDAVCAVYDEARSIASACSNDLAVARIDNNQAEVLVRNGQLKAGLDAYRTSRVLLLEAAANTEADVVSHNHAAALTRYRHLNEARPFVETCLHNFLSVNREDLAAKSYSLLGLLEIEVGNEDAAHAACSTDQEICQQISDTNGIARVYNNRAIVYALQGDTDQAYELIRESLLMNRDQADEHAVAQSEANLGFIDQLTGQLDSAIVHYERAVETFFRIGDRVSLMEVCCNVRDQPGWTSRLSRFIGWDEALDDYVETQRGFPPNRFLWNVSYGYLP